MSVVSLFALIDWLICPQKPNRLQEMQVQVLSALLNTGRLVVA